MEASIAATKAPRGAYYRRPGHISKTMPPIAEEVQVGEYTFYYNQGIFFRKEAEDRFVAMTPRVGAVVSTEPDGSLEIPAEGGTLYYYFGGFYKETGHGKFEVIKPPAGVFVPYLPDGYATFEEGDSYRLEFGGTNYTPVFDHGDVFFQVV